MDESLLKGYASAKGTSYDELWLGQKEILPHWRPFIENIVTHTKDDLERTRYEIRRLLQENGVTYNVHGDPDGLQRPWKLDLVPMIIGEQDWQLIEAGIKQRAMLLNLIAIDLYGERRLVQQGYLPAGLIFGHYGFLRPCVGIDLRGQPLMIYAADLGRGPDNRMWVLGDRTQAPSGAGYALENRTVMARVQRSFFGEGKIRRLSNFFRDFQTALAKLAPREENPRIVVLTPGPFNETYFEHAYLANYLGYSLVQGDDLTVRDGQVWLKSIEGLRPVDVIMRRVDDAFCDPLELNKSSWLGVPGLVESVRRKQVSIANSLGSGILENPGLMPFLPGLAKLLLGESLILPSAATWWCGQPKELAYVLEHLDRLVIKRIARSAGQHTIFGNKLSKDQLAQLREQIKANPAIFVGQEQVSFSTVPTLIDEKLEARHTILRTFAVATDHGYSVMPGGLTRSSARTDTLVVSNQVGGFSRDTWVICSEPETYVSLWLEPQRVLRTFKQSFSLPSRAAENLFWVGRYAERAEATARLLRTIFNQFGELDFVKDAAEVACLHQLLRSLTQVTMTYPGFVDEEEKDALERLLNPQEELRSVTLDSDRLGSLSSNIKGMVRAAFAVRDLWSVDSWRVIDRIHNHWSDLIRDQNLSLHHLWHELNELITQLLAFSGLNAENMTQGSGWILLDSGRRLERAVLTMSFVRSMLSVAQSAEIELLLLENILTTTENIITYRRRYRSHLHIQSVIEQLLLDETNPRSVIYQLNRLQNHLRDLPRDLMPFRMSKEEKLVMQSITQLKLIEMQNVVRADETTNAREVLSGLLGELTDYLSELSTVLTQYYFSHAEVPHQLVIVASEPVVPAEV